MIPSRAFSKSLDIDVSSQRHLPGVMSEDVLDHPQERTLSSQVQSVKHSLGAYLDIFLCREAQFNGLVDSPWANESSIKRVFPIRCCYHKDAPAFRCSEPLRMRDGRCSDSLRADTVHLVEECRQHSRVNTATTASSVALAERALVGDRIKLIKEQKARRCCSCSG